MSGLFMAFKINREPREKKKKRPALPSRGDISEDSMEDMVSNELNQSIQDREKEEMGRRLTE